MERTRHEKLGIVLAIVMAIQQVAVILTNNTLVELLYRVAFPLFAGILIRYVTGKIDQHHKPAVDFPLWFYLISWVILSLPLLALYSSSEGGLTFISILLCVLGLVLPISPIRPNTIKKEVEDEANNPGNLSATDSDSGM